jgi:UPF0755 protein
MDGVTDVQPAPPAAPPPPGPPPGNDPRYGREWVDYEPIRIRKGERGTYLALAFLMVVVVGLVVVALLVARWVRAQLDPPGEQGAAVVLTLDDGASTSSIGPDLEDAGVIGNDTFFQWYVRIKGGVEFQAGEYTFHENSAAWDVLDVLKEGPTQIAQAVNIPITLPEGLTIEEMAARLDENPDLPFSGDDYLAELVVGDYRSGFAPAPNDLGDVIEPYEGLLYPDTYAVLDTSTPAELISQQVATLDRTLEELGYAASEERFGLTPYEMIIVASLIEEEAKIDEDRAKISRVIHNRLQAGWELGIDATVIYATGDREITVEDLEFDSPYNTRLHPGLPPTPIAAPGRASLEAAMNPADGPWMYYVLTDPSGAHSFAETEEEFLQYKAQCVELGLCTA